MEFVKMGIAFFSCAFGVGVALLLLALLAYALIMALSAIVKWDLARKRNALEEAEEEKEEEE